MVGHEERVEIFVVAVQRIVAAHEFDGYLVFLSLLFQVFPTYDKMLVAIGDGSKFAVHNGLKLSVFQFSLEIELQIIGSVIAEADDCRARHRLVFLVGNAKTKVVLRVADVGRTVFGQFFRHSRFDVHGKSGAAKTGGNKQRSELQAMYITHVVLSEMVCFAGKVTIIFL